MYVDFEVNAPLTSNFGSESNVNMTQTKNKSNLARKLGAKIFTYDKSSQW